MGQKLGSAEKPELVVVVKYSEHDRERQVGKGVMDDIGRGFLRMSMREIILGLTRGVNRLYRRTRLCWQVVAYIYIFKACGCV